MVRWFSSLLTAIGLVVAAAPAQSAYVFEAAEFDDTNIFDVGEVIVANWQLTLAPDEVITYAFFQSNFGNSTAQSSAVGTVKVNGIEVARCNGPAEPCWDGPGAPIRYSFKTDQFASLIGSISLIYDRADCCAIRLGPAQLTIATNRSPLPGPPPAVPEPQSWAPMLLGFGLAGSLLRARRTFAWAGPRALLAHKRQ